MQKSLILAFTTLITTAILLSNSRAEETTVPAGKYLLSNKWEKASSRISALQESLDPESKKRITPFLKPGSKCLEIGPGLGSMTHFIAKQISDETGGWVVAIDNDDTFLGEVKGDFTNIETQHADITTLEMETDEYDFIYSRLVLIHLTKADHQQLIDKLTAALKPGGTLFIDTFLTPPTSQRFQSFQAKDERMPGYLDSVYSVLESHIDSKLGYRLSDMFTGAGLINMSAKVHGELVSAGTPNARYMKLSLEQLKPYFTGIDHHDELHDKLLSAFDDDTLHWFDHFRLFIHAQKDEAPEPGKRTHRIDTEL